MNKESIKQAYNEVSKVLYSGETPIVTVEYGTKTLSELKAEFKADGFYTTIIDLDGKGVEEIRKELGILKDALRMLDAKSVVFVEFRANEKSFKEALVVNEHLRGFCVLVKKAWKQEGIEIGKI